jgi:hypothetical protein
MHIKLTDIRHHTTGEVLCDICCHPIELDEDCSYLTPDREFPHLEPLLAHNACFRRAPRERLRGYWATLTRARTILESIVNSPRRSRHPQLDALLNDLKEQRQKHDQ